jgi:hypothetical protein
MSTGSFPGVKRPGRGVDHPPPSRAEVKERVELYLYSPCRPSWPVLGLTLPAPYFLRYASCIGFHCLSLCMWGFQYSRAKVLRIQIFWPRGGGGDVDLGWCFPPFRGNLLSSYSAIEPRYAVVHWKLRQQAASITASHPSTQLITSDIRSC